MAMAAVRHYRSFSLMVHAEDGGYIECETYHAVVRCHCHLGRSCCQEHVDHPNSTADRLNTQFWTSILRKGVSSNIRCIVFQIPTPAISCNHSVTSNIFTLISLVIHSILSLTPRLNLSNKLDTLLPPFLLPLWTLFLLFLPIQ
jgi:hypothetical protein